MIFLDISTLFFFAPSVTFAPVFRLLGESATYNKSLFVAMIIFYVFLCIRAIARFMRGCDSHTTTTTIRPHLGMNKLTSRTRVYSLCERWFIPPGWKYGFPNR